MEENELGRLRKNENTEIVVRLSKFREEFGLDIREYVQSKNYTGFTRKGVRIPVGEVDELKKILADVKLE